jgi:hypothetical protein
MFVSLRIFTKMFDMKLKCLNSWKVKLTLSAATEEILPFPVSIHAAKGEAATSLAKGAPASGQCWCPLFFCTASALQYKI